MKPLHTPWLALALVLATAAGVFAQTTGSTTRYFIRPIPGAAAGNIPHADLVAIVNGVGATVIEDIDYPQFSFNAVASNLTAFQADQLRTGNTSGTPPLFVIEDAPLVPMAGKSGPAPDPRDQPVNWALNLLATGAPAINPCCTRTPVVYVVDTGILQTHAEFTSTTFRPGISYVAQLPNVDPQDHGTRVAGCLGGSTTGLLPKLGLPAKLRSVCMYPPPVVGASASTFASTAINAILGGCVVDHVNRKSGPYLGSRQSIMIFASSTVPYSAGVAGTGRIADLDRAVNTAWNAGVTVVMAGGNDNVLAAGVSPAGSAWGFTPPGVPVRFFYGPLPGGTSFTRVVDQFLVAGAHTQSLGFWGSSNTNTTTVDCLDVGAPGVSVITPSSTGVGAFVTTSGTSYAAGYTAGAAAVVGSQRFWATPTQLRDTIRTARVAGEASPPWQRLKLPTVIPDLCLSFAAWAALHQLAGPNADPLADPDADGMANLIEYYCGLDPRFTDSASGPGCVETSPGVVKITIPVACYPQCSPAEYCWVLQKSTDLLTWTDKEVPGFIPAPGCPQVGDGTLYQATWPDPAGPPLPGQPRAFYRVKFRACGPG